MDPPDHPGRSCPENPKNKVQVNAKDYKSLLPHLGAVLFAVFVAIVFIGTGTESVGTIQQRLLF